MNTSDLYPGTLWGSAPQSWFFRNSSAASRMRSIVVFTQGGEWRFMHSVGCVTVLCGTKRAIWEAFPLAFERVIKPYYSFNEVVQAPPCLQPHRCQPHARHHLNDPGQCEWQTVKRFLCL